MDTILARLALLVNGEWRDLASRIDAVDWSFAAGGGLLLAAGVPVAAVIAGLCYLRTTEGLRPWLRVTLGILRFVAIVCLLLIAAGTVCRVHVIRNAKPGLVVLVDDSPSMELAQGGQSRLAQAEAALQSGGGLDHLRRDYDVQVLRSSTTLDQARDLPQDLAAAIVRASTAAGPAWPPAQVVVVSDGIRVGGEPLAAAAPLVGAPVSAVSFGNGENVRDLLIRSATIPPFVYAGDRVLVTAEVRAFGIGTEVSLRLAQVDGKTSKDVASVKVTPKPDGSATPVRLEFVANQPGLQHYALVLGPAADELTEANNTLRFYLDVRAEKIRVLFAEGQPGWEYRLAKTALETDPAVAFHGILRLPPDEWFYQGPALRDDAKPVLRQPKNGLPDGLEELAYFDVVILGDLERKTFEEGKRFELLDQYVRERGGGLGTIGGMTVYNAGHYQDTLLARLLPFRLANDKKTQLVNRFNVKLTPEGLLHPITQLEIDPAKNEEAWAGLPWVEGGNAISRVKPSATELLVHPTLRTKFGARPLAAAWEVGRGRVYSTALDGTWHWSMARKTDTDYHRRYWGLLVRWLAGDLRVQRGNALILETPICEAGKPVTVALTLRNASGLPVVDAEAVAQLALPGGEAVTAGLLNDPARPGRYGLTFVPRAAGACSVTVDAKLADNTTLKRTLSFVVDPSRAEFLWVRPDAAALTALATATGGKVVAIADAQALTLPPPVFHRQAATVSVRVWHAPGVLLVLLGCVMLEWFARKRRGLA